MSCNESKLVLRAEIPSLKGKSNSEALKFFRRILGEPSEIDEWNDEIDYFSYEGIIRPCHDYSSGRWGIEYILLHESDYNVYVEMDNIGATLEEINEIAGKLENMFNVNKDDVKLIYYTWYNGSDEPVKF